MLTSKQMTLKPILESKDGIHLTAYLVNRGDLINLKSQLRTTINEAYEWLNNAMSAEARNKFLEPLDALMHDARILKDMKGNIGIFRNEDSFRILNIPISVEPSCQVATSFHVKPLLRWLQGDQEFLLLGLEKDSAHLYLGSQDSFKLIDSILLPESNCQNQMSDAETFSWVNDWIIELTKNSKPKLFIAGEPFLVQALSPRLSYSNAVRNPISNHFRKDHAAESTEPIRKILKADSKSSLEKSLLEFRFAESINRVQKNIFQIAKAVVQGRVRKLIVTDDFSIFGKIDEKSGGVAIHPFDLDHEDDCILDDLAQMVLSQGGEVIVAKRDEIPRGRPILAILDDEGFALEKTDDLQFEVLEERFG